MRQQQLCDFVKCILTNYHHGGNSYRIVKFTSSRTWPSHKSEFGMIRHGKYDKLIGYVLTLVQHLCVTLLFVFEREAFVSDESSVNLIISTFLAERCLFMVIYGHPTRVFESFTV